MLAALGTIVDFISTLLTGIIQVFALVAQSMVFMATLWTLIPPVLVVFASAGVGIAVFYHFIGR